MAKSKTENKSKTPAQTKQAKPKAQAEKPAPLRFKTKLNPPAKYKTKDHGQCEITAIDSGKGRASAYLIGKDNKGETVRIETQSRATALAAIGYVYDGNGGGIPKDQAAAKTAA